MIHELKFHALKNHTRLDGETLCTRGYPQRNAMTLVQIPVCAEDKEFKINSEVYLMVSLIEI